MRDAKKIKINKALLKMLRTELVNGGERPWHRVSTGIQKRINKRSKSLPRRRGGRPSGKTDNVNTLLAKHLSKRICQASLIKRSMRLSSWCNDWALPILSGYAEAHIWQGTPAYWSSRRGSRDEASMGPAHQEEETTAILDRYRRLAEAESEWWKR